MRDERRSRMEYKGLKLSDSTKNRNEILKVIAVLSMIVDHIGYTFFPQFLVLRMIGRLAFPIFAHQIAQGYVYTSNSRKYMMRLWIFAVISQGPFMLLFDTTNLNVMVTLGLGLFVIDCYQKKRYVVMLPLLATAYYVPMDYGIFGVLLVLAFYIFREQKGLSAAVQFIMLAIFSYTGWYFQMLAYIGSLLCLFLPVNLVEIKLNKYIFYWFYPVHLLIIYLISQYII
jgi:hypothetical protein